MPMLEIKNLEFSYPGAEPLFSDINLTLDTSWRLGLVGRNGRGKTTLLKLFCGKLPYKGSINTPAQFSYFPPHVADENKTAMAVALATIAPFEEWEADMARFVAEGSEAAIAKYGEIEEAYAAQDGYTVRELLAAEIGRLGVQETVLQRPYHTLSGGERVKLLLAALFLKKHHFLLIDEPTDHLDAKGRQLVGRWLAQKQGFILVSHDREFLDISVDHILAINRADIELQKGNYSSWRHNRTMQDEFELAQNQKLEKEIAHLKVATERTKKWSDKLESSKIGSAGVTYNKGPASVDRGFIGHKSAKMMQRSKAIERRQTHQIEQKEKLLHNLEQAEPLKFPALKAEKQRLVTLEKVSFEREGRMLFQDLDLSIDRGERVAVSGENGSGKTTLLQLVLGQLSPTRGSVHRMASLVCSILPQSADFLSGSLEQFAARQQIDKSLLYTLLRKLDFERELFTQSMESYSAGQKKKVCLAASLAKPAHLFVWDEPLNYIDVLSREQIEQAALESEATMLFVEHDARFCQRLATKTLTL